MNSEEYNQNPKICKQCNAVIPYKQRYNIFCSSSCAATFNNTGAKRSEAHKSAISESIKKYNISIGKVAKEKVKRKRIKKLVESKAKKPSNALPDEKAKFDIESYKNLYPNVVSVVGIYLQANITKPRIILVVKLSDGKKQTRSYPRAIYELYRKSFRFSQ